MTTEVVRFAIAAGETKAFARAGRYIEVLSAADPLSINLYGEDGGRGDSAVSVPSGIYLETPFGAFDVTSATAQTIELLVSDARGGSRRQPGVVQVIDGGRARTLADQAFIGYASVTGGPGFIPIVELFNPAGSGRRVIVKAIRVSTPTAGSVSLGLHNATLSQGPFDPQNKRLGGVTSSAKLYREPGLAASPGSSFESLSVGANLVVPITLQEPIIVNPGFALQAWHQTVATTMLAAFEFVEELLV